jgi:hypothetical protein
VESFEFRRSSDNQALLSAPVSGESATNAHFLIQMVRDPASGSSIVSAYGYWAEGTVAARWYLANVVLPALTTYTDAWYIYEWESINADVGPDAGDTFTLVSSGG